MNVSADEESELFNATAKKDGSAVQVRIISQAANCLLHYRTEVEVLQKLKHCQIARVLDVFEDCICYIYVLNVDSAKI